MRSPNVWKGQNSNECKNIRFCSKVFLHLIWFWHDPFWVGLKAMEGRVLQTLLQKCSKIRLNGFLCRTLIGSINMPGLPPRNIVLASLETTKWFAQVTQMTIRTYRNPSPGTCSAWTWHGTLWARCPVRRFFNWRTSTSLISPSTRSRSLRKTLLLVSSFRIEKLTQHNDISHTLRYSMKYIKTIL